MAKRTMAMQVEYLLSALVGRLAKRLLGFLLLGLFALIAIYHFTTAGMIALENDHGALTARLIVAGLYTLAALITFGIIYATRARPRLKKPVGDALPAEPEMRIAMLLESVMLGYSLARKQSR